MVQGYHGSVTMVQFWNGVEPTLDCADNSRSSVAGTCQVLQVHVKCFRYMSSVAGTCQVSKVHAKCIR